MRVLYKISKLILFVMMLNFHCYADTKRINFNELQNELSEKKVSDTLIIKSGKFENQVISIRDKKGIVIIADDIDKVVLTGRIQFIIENSEDIELSNFIFMNTKSKQLIKINNSNRIRILNNLFSNCIGESPYSCIIGLQKESSNNLIKDNTFENILAMGIRIDDGLNIKNEISCNAFIGVPSVKSIYPNLPNNGFESIAIGKGSHFPVESQRNVVANNYFFNIIGDGMEVIANKSNDNIIEGNYFNNNKGGVSIRYGNNCIVKNNIFVNNEQNIRLFGKGHEVYGNYIEKSKFGIRIPSADFSNDDIIDTVGYYQGEDISIHENYFFEITNEEIMLGEKFDKKRVLQPNNIKVKKIKSSFKEESHQIKNRYKKLAENIKDNAGKR